MIRRDRAWNTVELVAVWTLAILLWTSCRSAPTCPVVVPPAPVTIPAPKIPCARPEKPVPPDLEKHLGAYDANHALIDGETIKALGVYVLATEARFKADDDCLAVATGKVLTIPKSPPDEGSGSGSNGDP